MSDETKPRSIVGCTAGLGLDEACRIVEQFARTLGKNCQIIFCDDCVSVAPLAWAGDATGKTLHEALTEARKSEES